MGFLPLILNIHGEMVLLFYVSSMSSTSTPPPTHTYPVSAVRSSVCALHYHCLVSIESGVQASGEGVKKLEFQLTDSLRASIDKARACVEEKCGSLSVSAVQYDRYGSDFIKSSGLRADPVIQLAIQVTSL